MSGYVYQGSGVDELTPDLEEFAPDFPVPKTYLAAPYVAELRMACAAGQHVAFTTTDRAGVWFWACRHCPSYRVQGDPTWRTP